MASFEDDNLAVFNYHKLHMKSDLMRGGDIWCEWPYKVGTTVYTN